MRETGNLSNTDTTYVNNCWAITISSNNIKMQVIAINYYLLI